MLTDTQNLFMNGLTDYLILSILEKKDSYVYEIVSDISKLSDGVLAISQNTFYTASYKLEERGFITNYSKLVGRKRTRVYYHLEPSGNEFLKKLSANYERTVTGVQNIINALEQGTK